MSSQSCGWYPDPLRQAPLRWWDGHGWTVRVHPPGWGHPVPASWMQRVRAHLLDAMCLWACSLLLFHVWQRALYDEVLGVLVSTLMTQGGSLPSPATLWDYGLPQLWLATAVPGVVLRIVWDMVWLTRRGATWGHRQERLGVVTREAAAAAQGLGAAGLADRPLPWRAALVRSLVLRASAPLLLPWLVVVLWPLHDPQRRSLADVAAGTLVVSGVAGSR